MKKVLSIILSVLMLTSITAGLNLTAYADDETQYKDGIWTYTVTDGNATIIGDKSISGDQTIPSEIGADNYPVTSLSGSFGDYSQYSSQLTSIIIPDSVTSISASAFCYCTRLESVIIGDGLTSIEASTFNCCVNLTSVTIGNNVTSIGSYAFSACSSLTSITIPDSVTSIGDGAFSVCTSLTSITIPDSVTSIGNSAFYNCTSLTDVYYSGSESEFNNITIGSDNNYLKNATIHYYYNCTHETTMRDEAVAPTCTETGLTEGKHCSVCGEVIVAQEEIAATGHKYTNITYTWNDDKSKCTALAVCQNDGTHVVAEIATATSAVTTEPKCETKGIRTYTAEFDNELFAEQTTTDVIDALEHDYKITYEWNDDKSECTATAVCQNDETHIVAETATVTSAVTTEPKCETKGVRTYTAEFDNELFAKQTTTNEIDALEHDFGDNEQYCLNGCGTENTNYVAPSSDDNNSSSGDNSGTSGNNSSNSNNGSNSGNNDSNGSNSGSGSTTNANQSANSSANTTTSTTATTSTPTAEESKIAETYGVDAETAKQIVSVLNQYNVSSETAALTEAAMTTTVPKGDGDYAGSSFGLLRARTTKLKKNSITVKWNNVTGADGYIIYGAKCGKKSKYKVLATVSAGTTSYTQKKLKKGTYYKYNVIAYKNVNGTKVTIAASKKIHAITKGGKYGVAKSVKVNKAKVTLKKGKKFQIKASEVKQDKTIKKHRTICYESSNANVATVNSKGKITAKGKGKCTIYVYAQNGVYKTITVTVK